MNGGKLERTCGHLEAVRIRIYDPANYILFLVQVLLISFHVPPSLTQSCSLLAFFISPANTGPVQASARVTAKIEIKIFMAFLL